MGQARGITLSPLLHNSAIGSCCSCCR